MKKRLLSLALVLTMACSVVPIVNFCVSAETETEATSGNNVESILDRIKSDFDLVWHDEFDGDTLDETKWQYDGDTVFRNSEAQMYSNGPEDGNVYMENGNVVLKAKKENVYNNNGVTRKYSSGEISTQGKAHFKYGFFEFNAKIPYGDNTFPAIWMMGYDYKTGTCDWPHSGEIDIFESLGGSTTWSTLHFSRFGQSGSGSHTTKGAGGYSNPDKHPMYDEYHKFWLYWTDTTMVIGCDESWFNVIDITADPALAQSFRNYEHWILFDLAMGPYGNTIKEADTDDWRFYIDYARVYQPKDDSLYENYKIVDAENCNTDNPSGKSWSMNSATYIGNAKLPYINSVFDDFKAGTYDIYAAFTAQPESKTGVYDVTVNGINAGTLTNGVGLSTVSMQSAKIGRIKLTEDNLPFELKFNYNSGTNNNLQIDKYFFVKTDDETGAVVINQDSANPKSDLIEVSSEQELDAAIDNVSKGGTIKFTSDITLTSKKNYRKSCTLDLNGHKLTYASKVAINISVATDFKVINGTLVSNDGIMTNSETDNLKVTFENVIFNIGRSTMNVGDALMYDWYRTTNWVVKNCTFNFTASTGDTEKTVFICGSNTTSNKITFINTTINGNGFCSPMRIRNNNSTAYFYNCNINNCEYVFKSTDEVSSASPVIKFANTTVNNSVLTNNSNNLSFVKLADNNTACDLDNNAVTLENTLTDFKIICNHSYSDATCETLSTCAYCMDEIVEPLSGHTPSDPEITDSDCFYTGKKVVKCSVCDEVISEEIIPIKQHKFELTTTYEPSCDLAGGGYKVFTCTLCGFEQTRSYTGNAMPAKVSHTPDLTKRTAKEATCTAGGCITDYCTVCNKTYISRRYRGGHKYEQTAVKGNCLEESYTLNKCSVCGDEYKSDVVAASGSHTPDSAKDKVVDPTFDREGYTEHTCLICGEVYKDTFTDKLTDETYKVDITMYSGAQIRLNDVSGIRFLSVADADKIAALKADGADVELGTLIMPKDLLNDEELTFETSISGETPINVKYEADEWHNHIKGQIAGSIINIKEGNIAREFVGRAYVKVTKDGKTYTNYADVTDENIRSLAFVANALKNDTENFNKYNDDIKQQVEEWAKQYIDPAA